MPRFWSELVEQRMMEMLMRGNYINIKTPMKIAMHNCSNMMHDEVFVSKVTALNFDIVLYDGVFICSCNIILAHHLSVPAVSVFFFLIMGWNARVPVNPAVIPAMLHVKKACKKSTKKVSKFVYN